MKQENLLNTIPSALVQSFRTTHAQQNGKPEQAMDIFQSLLKDKEVHEMLVRLRDK